MAFTILTRYQLNADPFRAPASQIATSVGVVLVIVAAALMIGPRLTARPAGTAARSAARSPLFAGVTSFVMSSAFVALATMHGKLPVAAVVTVLVVLLAMGCYLLLRASRSGWTPRHEAAVAGGTLMTYVWHGFVQVPSVGKIPAWLDATGNAIFAAGAIWLLLRALKRTA